MAIITNPALLSLLQLASPALPVGAYSYSEGLETLITEGKIQNSSDLQRWLELELRHGAIAVEAAVLVGAYQTIPGDLQQLQSWNAWLSAFRETEELRLQSWQMGRSLLKLLLDLQIIPEEVGESLRSQPCNFAIAFALAATHWQIDLETAVLGYLQSWVTNLINAGIKLIPLGQTAGQKLLLDLQPILIQTTSAILNQVTFDLKCCTWGLTLASMQHETQYSRLFRS
uniref:Urease accessory protein UreF n=1 Tax=Cyanothece sp. (strain PCC 7425 / ATCC 29141) TaxID=395961 RepID=B8HW48_CYAP4